MKSNLDYIDIASQIYARLEMEYGFAAPKDQAKEELWKFLGSQLARHSDLEVLAWQDALDQISNEGSDYPPKIPKLLMTMRRVARLVKEDELDRQKWLTSIIDVKA